jgi:hypothetical protein
MIGPERFELESCYFAPGDLIVQIAVCP